MSFPFAGEIEFAVSYFRANRMLFYEFRLEYVLEGSLKYISFKENIEVVLEDNELRNSWTNIFLSLQLMMLKILQSGESVWQRRE